MPMNSKIANAAQSFQLNDRFFTKTFEDLSPEDWLRRPNDSANHMLWIVGHVIWARGVALGFLGTQWSRPWLPLFARGAKLVDSTEYPNPGEAAAAWKDVSARLAAAMEEPSEEVLSAPSPNGIPSADGKISGLVNFFAYHDTYHAGQVAYMRRWLGHRGLEG